MQLAFIQLPEGIYVEAQSIVGFGPRTAGEFDTEPVAGCTIMLASGHSVDTEETTERIVHQLTEIAARLRDQ